MRLVVDTDVLVAGMRSPSGASAALLVLLLERRATMLLSVAMALEYESTCLRTEHLLAANATEVDARDMIDAIIDVIEPVELHYQWRPQLPDRRRHGSGSGGQRPGRRDCDLQPQGLRRGSGPLRHRNTKPGGSVEEGSTVTTKLTTVSLRLPVSLKAALDKLAASDGISMNQFLVTAAAEKLSAMQTAEAFFAERKGRGNRDAAIRFLTRAGGKSPRPDDELPAPGGDRG